VRQKKGKHTELEVPRVCGTSDDLALGIVSVRQLKSGVNCVTADAAGVRPRMALGVMAVNHL
jgi:hypothetical protein